MAVAGYWAYERWLVAKEPAAQESSPAVKVVAPPKPEPVNFAVKSRVRKLFEEWKRQELRTSSGEHSVAAVKASEEIKQIRQYLFREGHYSEGAIHDLVVRSLREMGVAESEIQVAANGVLSLGE